MMGRTSLSAITNGSKAHAGTLLVVALAVLGLSVSLLGYFAAEDRREMKTETHAAMAKAIANDVEIRLLKLSLQRVESDLKELKEGQKILLSRGK